MGETYLYAYNSKMLKCFGQQKQQDKAKRDLNLQKMDLY